MSLRLDDYDPNQVCSHEAAYTRYSSPGSSADLTPGPRSYGLPPDTPQVMRFLHSTEQLDALDEYQYRSEHLQDLFDPMTGGYPMFDDPIELVLTTMGPGVEHDYVEPPLLSSPASISLSPNQSPATPFSISPHTVQVRGDDWVFDHDSGNKLLSNLSQQFTDHAESFPGFATVMARDEYEATPAGSGEVCSSPVPYIKSETDLPERGTETETGARVMPRLARIFQDSHSHGFKPPGTSLTTPVSQPKSLFGKPDSSTVSERVKRKRVFSQHEDNDETAMVKGKRRSYKRQAPPDTSLKVTLEQPPVKTKRPRRRSDEIFKIYHCRVCTKAYGALNHLNQHIADNQGHGDKRMGPEYARVRELFRQYNDTKDPQKHKALLDEVAYLRRPLDEPERDESHLIPLNALKARGRARRAQAVPTATLGNLSSLRPDDSRQ